MADLENSGNLFIFITAFFIPISFNHSYLKVFWIFVYLTFSGLLYILGFVHSND
ncbi:hypothetical protein CRE_22875 [Caenorhabditis remanei]|uniref:Uncharacterized protein n=1 Tax=Caenorhabditis remanei TaxID=31234 RepID=E3MHB6_CAERE|nr:hypothetical protein CRE_22875 [Caenorhabditis remanei]